MIVECFILIISCLHRYVETLQFFLSNLLFYVVTMLMVWFRFWHSVRVRKRSCFSLLSSVATNPAEIIPTSRQKYLVLSPLRRLENILTSGQRYQDLGPTTYKRHKNGQHFLLRVCRAPSTASYLGNWLHCLALLWIMYVKRSNMNSLIL